MIYCVTSNGTLTALCCTGIGSLSGMNQTQYECATSNQGAWQVCLLNQTRNDPPANYCSPVKTKTNGSAKTNPVKWYMVILFFLLAVAGVTNAQVVVREGVGFSGNNTLTALCCTGTGGIYGINGTVYCMTGAVDDQRAWQNCLAAQASSVKPNGSTKSKTVAWYMVVSFCLLAVAGVTNA